MRLSCLKTSGQVLTHESGNCADITIKRILDSEKERKAISGIQKTGKRKS
jgi:hypothetical protein